MRLRLEAGAQRGSWLEASAAVLVSAARASGRTGLGVVGLDPLAGPLAIECARAGLRLIVLLSLQDDARTGGASELDADRLAWIQALGGQVVAVAASASELSAAAPAVLDGAGCRFVGPTDPLRHAGLRALVEQIDAEGRGSDLLCLPSLDGQEAAWLAAEPGRGPHTLPLDGLAVTEPGQPSAVVGALVGRARPRSAEMAKTVQAQAEPIAPIRPDVGPQDASGAVLAIPVTPRECDAARRLLAREEGIVASRLGTAGLAGLLHVLRDDRGRRLRERRFRRAPSVVVVVTADPLWAGGAAPRAADEVPRAAISLDTLAADPSRLLVRPPGW